MRALVIDKLVSQWKHILVCTLCTLNHSPLYSYYIPLYPYLSLCTLITPLCTLITPLCTPITHLCTLVYTSLAFCEVHIVTYSNSNQSKTDILWEILTKSDIIFKSCLHFTLYSGNYTHKDNYFLFLKYIYSY